MTDTANVTQPLVGCEVTAQTVPDMTVHVAAGAALVLNMVASVPALDVTITTADADHDRQDAIVADGSGLAQVIDGPVSDGSSALPPDTTGYALLAYVYVYSQAHPAYTGTIEAEVVIDQRDFFPVPADPGIIGYGADGDLVYDGDEVDDPFFPTGYLIGGIDADSGYLVRDASFANLTINAGKTLFTNGYILRVSNVLVNEGTIDNSGQAGRDGGSTGAGNGGPGGNAGNRLALSGSIDSNTGGDGVGGAAGNTNGGGSRDIWAGDGGKGGGSPSGDQTPTLDPSAVVGAFGPPDSPLYLLIAAANLYPGGGGGGGATDGVGGGGGGGSGGGIIGIFGRIIDNALGVISAKGGDGGAAEPGSDSSGGGPGGGGTITLYGVLVEGTIDVSAGTPGAGSGTGADGDPGTDGQVFKVGVL